MIHVLLFSSHRDLYGTRAEKPLKTLPGTVAVTLVNVGFRVACFCG